MKEWTIDQINILKITGSPVSALPAAFTAAGAGSPRAFHEQIDGYGKTPLVSLPHLAEK